MFFEVMLRTLFKNLNAVTLLSFSPRSFTRLPCFYYWFLQIWN